MRRTELFSGSSNKAYLLCFSLLCFFNPAVYSALASDSTLDLRNVSVANLIDDLVDIDAQAPDLHSTALVRTFIADNSPSEFGGGVIWFCCSQKLSTDDRAGSSRGWRSSKRSAEP
jgi:hypothetical protein